MKTSKFVVRKGLIYKRLSEYVTVEEFVNGGGTDGVIFDNTLPPDLLIPAMAVCVNVADRVRVYFGEPIRITSGYRCRQVNKAIGGSVTSQHVKAEAIDIKMDGVWPKQIYDYISTNLEFDQLILEPTWVHVSYKRVGNRKEKLIFKNGHYVAGK